MAISEDFQFDLLGYTFGLHRRMSTDQTGFRVTNGEVITQDSVNRFTGARMSARDIDSAGGFEWSIHVDTESDEEALAELAAMKKVWRNNGLGWKATGQQAMLSYRLAGRDRVVFGRPRKFDYELDNRLLGGYMPLTATFDLAYPAFYGSEEKHIDMNIGRDTPGGLSFPAAMPYAYEVEPGYVRPFEMKVGGDAGTHPIIKFGGPSTNPSVTIGTMTLGFSGTLEQGASIEVDCRPWAMTMKRANGGANLIPSRATRLNRAFFLPGTYSAEYRAIDTSGLSTCQVRWRDAWSTL